MTSFETNSSQEQSKIETPSVYSNGKMFETEQSQNTTVCHKANGEIVYIAEQDLKLFEHQVAGHGTLEKGLLKHKNGWILKPLQAPPKGAREVSFYQEIHGNRDKPQNIYYAKLKNFVPNFHGVACLANNNTQHASKNGVALQDQCQYLLIDDIIQGLKMPCVADIKIGLQTWSPDASEAKIKQELSKYKGTKLPLGLCFTGAHFYDSGTNERRKMTRDFGKTLDPTTLKIAIETFLNKRNTVRYRVLAQLTIKKLRELEEIFSAQKSFKLYGSSILIAYDAEFFFVEKEAHQSEKGAELDFDMTNVPLRVFMIDFAHFHPSEEEETVDENYLFGLRNLIKILCDIVEPSPQS